MKYLAYVSTAINLMSDAELFEMLVTNRNKKKALDITGVLLYSEGLFMQVLEGSNSAVDKNFKEIEKDKRNKNVIKLTEGVLTERNFQDWSMAFLPKNLAVFEEVEGFTLPADAGFLKTESVHPVIVILKTFIDNNAMRV